MVHEENWFKKHIIALAGLIIIVLGSIFSWWTTYVSLTDSVHFNSERIQQLEIVVRMHISDTTRHIDPVRDIRMNEEILRRISNLEQQIIEGNQKLRQIQ